MMELKEVEGRIGGWTTMEGEGVSLELMVDSIL